MRKKVKGNAKLIRFGKGDSKVGDGMKRKKRCKKREGEWAVEGEKGSGVGLGLGLLGRLIGGGGMP